MVKIRMADQISMTFSDLTGAALSGLSGQSSGYEVCDQKRQLLQMSRRSQLQNNELMAEIQKARAQESTQNALNQLNMQSLKMRVDTRFGFANPKENMNMSGISLAVMAGMHESLMEAKRAQHRRTKLMASCDNLMSEISSFMSKDELTFIRIKSVTSALRSQPEDEGLAAQLDKVSSLWNQYKSKNHDAYKPVMAFRPVQEAFLCL